MSNQIPSRFQLGGMPIEVIVATHFKVKDNIETLGQERTVDGKILLATHFTGRPMSFAKITNTFYHELTHAMLATMDHKLVDDEQFCTCLGNLLMEYENTKYDFIYDYLAARDDDNVFVKSVQRFYGCENLEVDPFYKDTEYHSKKKAYNSHTSVMAETIAPEPNDEVTYDNEPVEEYTIEQATELKKDWFVTEIKADHVVVNDGGKLYTIPNRKSK